MTSHSPALSGRSAVVTGASRGIGAGIAAALGTQGVRVFMLARNEARLKEVSDRIPDSVPLVCDVTDPKSIDRAAKRITRQLGASPDILVNNAGIFRVSLVEATTVESFVEIIDTNLVAPFAFVRTFFATVRAVDSRERLTRSSISSTSDVVRFAASAELDASRRTSVATTAKPWPCSPALAASIAALSARIFD